MTQETLIPLGLPLGEKFIIPVGFKRCFLTYDRDTKQAIVCLTNEDSPPRR